MSHPLHRGGSALRAVLIVLSFLFALPVAIIGISLLSYRASHVNAQDAERQRLRAETARVAEGRALDATQRGVTVPVRVAPAADIAQPGLSDFRPVNETAYETQMVEVTVAKVDPETGRTVYQKEHRPVRRAVTITSRVHKPRLASHDPKIQQLATELRGMKEDDPQRASKMDQLRKRLDLEFSQMHENQAEQIQQTEQRLAKLKSIHQQRMENKDKIVQRRIDELLGEIDALQWNPTPTLPGPVPMTQRFDPTRPASDYRNPDPAVSPVLSPTNSVVNRPSPSISGTPLPTGLYGQPAFSPPLESAENSAAEFEKGMRKLFALGNSPAPPDQPPSNDRPKDSEMGAAVESAGVDASTSVISKLFEVARNSASSKSALAAAEVELAQKRGAIPPSEVRRLALHEEQLRGQVALNKFELEAMSEAIDRELELAKSAMEHAEQSVQLIQTRYRAGIVGIDKLDTARYEMLRARKQFEAASANVRQLEKVLEIIDGTGNEKTKESEGSDNNESTK